jgi:hypothetical protein
MDLAPETLGGRYGYRVCAVISDWPVIAHRLSEITGQPVDDFPEKIMRQMIRLMRRDLRAGRRIDYDKPPQLLQLYERAKADLEQTDPPSSSANRISTLS